MISHEVLFCEKFCMVTPMIYATKTKDWYLGWSMLRKLPVWYTRWCVRRNPGMVHPVFYALKASVWHLQLSMLRKFHYTMTNDICYENLSIVPRDDLYHESLVRDPEYLCYENSSKILYMIYAIKIPLYYSQWSMRRKPQFDTSDDVC